MPTCTWYAGDGNTATGPGNYVPYNSFAAALAATSGFGEPDVIWGSVSAFFNKDGSAPYVSIIYTAAGVHQGWNWQIGIIGSPNADHGFGNLASGQAALAGAQSSPLLPYGFCTATTSNSVISCDPQSLITSASCYRCIPRGNLRQVMVYLLCQWTSATITPSTPGVVIIDNGAGGFCQLVVDVTGNVGAQPVAGPATGPAPVLADGLGGFWQIITDSACDRGTMSVAGPATVPVPTLIDSNSVVWTLIADQFGNLGASS